MSEPMRLLTLQFLEWVAARPRTYSEVMEAWRTSCPRLTVWEDAVDGGLVRLAQDGHQVRVVVTWTGRAMLRAEIKRVA